MFVKGISARLNYRIGEIEKSTEICNQLIEECLSATDPTSIMTLGETYLTMGAICKSRASTVNDNWIATALNYYEKAYIVFETQNDIFWKIQVLRLLVGLHINKNREQFEKYYLVLEAIYPEAKKSYFMTSSGGGVITLGLTAQLLGDVILKGIRPEAHTSNDSTKEHQEISATTYFEESVDYFIKIGEYYPAIETARRLFDQWKSEKYDGKILAQKLTDLVNILDIDPGNGTSMSALDDVYQIFNHLIKSAQISTQSSDKQDCLQKALGFFNAKKFKEAIPFLEQGLRICRIEETKSLQSGRPYIPDRNDILIYQRLYDVYQNLNVLKDEQAMVLEFQRIRSLKVSANLLELGEYYEAQNIFPLAIRMYYIAGSQKPDSYFAQRARQHRESLCEKMGPEISPYCK